MKKRGSCGRKCLTRNTLPVSQAKQTALKSKVDQCRDHNRQRYRRLNANSRYEDPPDSELTVTGTGAAAWETGTCSAEQRRPNHHGTKTKVSTRQSPETWRATARNSGTHGWVPVLWASIASPGDLRGPGTRGARREGRRAAAVTGPAAAAGGQAALQLEV